MKATLSVEKVKDGEDNFHFIGTMRRVVIATDVDGAVAPGIASR